MSTRNGCRILPGMYQRRTAVWEGRGATARPREANWSSGVAAVLGYITSKMFSKIYMDITTTTEQHYIIKMYQVHQ